MIVKKKNTTMMLKIKCANCGSDDVSYWDVYKTKYIKSNSKIRCNKCFIIQKLSKFVLEEFKKEGE